LGLTGGGRSYARGVNVRDEQEPKAGEQRGLRWVDSSFVWTTVLGLTAYVLSIGPAARLVQERPSLEPACNVIYAPIVLLVQRSQFCQSVAMGYVRLWGVHVDVYVK
jgi:hypothetical protein